MNTVYTTKILKNEESINHAKDIAWRVSPAAFCKLRSKKTWYKGYVISRSYLEIYFANEEELFLFTLQYQDQ